MIVDIQGRPGLVRDIASGAIVNTNRTDYENHLTRQSRVQGLNEKVAQQQQEIESIKSSISDIKDMLALLLSQRN